MRQRDLGPAAWLLVSVLVETSALPLAVQSAQAALTTCATLYPLAQIAGYRYTNVSYEYGDQASIQYRIPGLCSTATNRANAWVMTLSNDTTGWTQIGYETKTNGHSNRFFWQWAKSENLPDPYCSTPPCLHTAVWGSPMEAEYHLFSVVFLSSDNREHVQLDGTDAPDNGLGVPSTTSFNPLVQWATPLRGQWMEEIQYCESDYPGTPNYRTNFTDMKQEDSSGSYVAHQVQTTGDWTYYPGLTFFRGSIDSTYPPAHVWQYTDRGQNPEQTCPQ